MRLLLIFIAWKFIAKRNLFSRLFALCLFACFFVAVVSGGRKYELLYMFMCVSGWMCACARKGFGREIRRFSMNGNIPISVDL